MLIIYANHDTDCNTYKYQPKNIHNHFIAPVVIHPTITKCLTKVKSLFSYFSSSVYTQLWPINEESS